MQLSFLCVNTVLESLCVKVACPLQLSCPMVSANCNAGKGRKKREREPSLHKDSNRFYHRLESWESTENGPFASFNYRLVVTVRARGIIATELTLSHDVYLLPQTLNKLKLKQNSQGIIFIHTCQFVKLHIQLYQFIFVQFYTKIKGLYTCTKSTPAYSNTMQGENYSSF